MTKTKQNKMQQPSHVGNIYKHYIKGAFSYHWERFVFFLLQFYFFIHRAVIILKDKAFTGPTFKYNKTEKQQEPAFSSCFITVPLSHEINPPPPEIFLVLRWMNLSQKR